MAIHGKSSLSHKQAVQEMAQKDALLQTSTQTETKHTQMNTILLHAGIAQHNGDWNWKNVRSPFARIYYVVEGNAEIVFNDHKSLLHPGFLYIVPPFTTHSNRCDGPFTHYYAHIYEQTDKEDGLFENYAFPDKMKAEEIDALLFRRLCVINNEKRLAQSNPDSYDNATSLMHSVAANHTGSMAVRMESNGIITQLLSRFMEKSRPIGMLHDGRMAKVARYIRHNLHKNITIDELAEMSSLSKDHFIRLFKADYGESPLQYINHRKIELAETLLATTDLNIKQIASRTGFDDHSYFIRLFRKTTGTTPATYRTTCLILGV
jgi:AraC-type DNA-binding domain-containing proteins